VQATALHEPVDLELDTRVDEVVKVTVHVFQGQGVRVDEVVANEEVELGWQIHQCGSMVDVGRCCVVYGMFGSGLMSRRGGRRTKTTKQRYHAAVFTAASSTRWW
jgi:hypothetical protein